MRKELTLKQDDFWRLLAREQFLWLYFNARLRYRIPSTNNGSIYVQVICEDQTINEHAEQYIKSYLEPKHTRSIHGTSKHQQISRDTRLLNRLMREYVVHIDVQEKDQSHEIIFHSLSLTVLYLAIDDFVKSSSELDQSQSTMVTDAKSVLQSLSKKFESELSIVNEQDQIDEEEKVSSSTRKSSQKTDEDEMESAAVQRTRKEPSLKIAYPGAESKPREATLEELVVKAPKKKGGAQRGSQPSSSSNADNDLVREMRDKLRGKTLRDVIIDGANIGRTYGDSVFSSRGIKLAVDLFQSYGYPDSKIVVIVPAHYLPKDKDNVFPDLIHRKILHKAFHQKIDDQNKRFYDDRLIVDLAVIRQGLILSNDFYRDLLQDSGEAVGKAIRERLLCYRFIGDDLCLPNPVSEGGLPLDRFLTK